MTIKRLSAHPSAQCTIVIDGNSIDFISYTTRVISVRYADGKRKIECTGTYSPTTRRQISWFCREYLPDLTYSALRDIAGAGMIAM